MSFFLGCDFSLSSFLLVVMIVIIEGEGVLLSALNERVGFLSGVRRPALRYQLGHRGFLRLRLLRLRSLTYKSIWPEGVAFWSLTSRAGCKHISLLTTLLVLLSLVDKIKLHIFDWLNV